MANKQLKDFITAENNLDGQELVYVSQSDKTRKSTLEKIKEFIIGNKTLTTTDKTVTGAIEEVKGNVDNNTTQLNEKANKTDLDNTNNTLTTHLNRVVCEIKVLSNFDTSLGGNAEATSTVTFSDNIKDIEAVWAFGNLSSKGGVFDFKRSKC